MNNNIYIPDIMYSRGLKKVVLKPLASDNVHNGKRWSKHMFFKYAIQKKFLQFNNRQWIFVLTIDIDNAKYSKKLKKDVVFGYIPHPSFIIENLDNGHIQFSYILKNPIFIQNKVSKAVRYFMRIRNYLLEKYDADTNHSRNHMCKNPMEYVHNGQCKTYWGELSDGFTLDELNKIIPDDWTWDAKKKNNFNEKLKNSGGLYLQKLANSLYTQYRWKGVHLDEDTLFVMVSKENIKRIEKPVTDEYYIRKSCQEAISHFGPKFDDGSQDRQMRKYKSNMGKKSGVVRRETNKDRDNKIIDMHLGGVSQRIIADTLACSRGSVIHTIKRYKKLGGCVKKNSNVRDPLENDYYEDDYYGTE